MVGMQGGRRGRRGEREKKRSEKRGVHKVLERDGLYIVTGTVSSPRGTTPNAQQAFSAFSRSSDAACHAGPDSLRVGLCGLSKGGEGEGGEIECANRHHA